MLSRAGQQASAHHPWPLPTAITQSAVIDSIYQTQKQRGRVANDTQWSRAPSTNKTPKIGLLQEPKPPAGYVKHVPPCAPPLRSSPIYCLE